MQFPNSQEWSAAKADQKFGVLPRLTVKSADGSVKVSSWTPYYSHGDLTIYIVIQHLWESVAIEAYLAETFGLLPVAAFERAESMSIVYSLNEMKDKVSNTVNLPTPEERGKVHLTHINETIPNHLKWHEAIIERGGGLYYNGNKVRKKIIIS
jgi:hypothetical protein